MEPDLKESSSHTPGWFAAHAASRAEIYAMLATLLEQPPTEELLQLLQNLQGDEALPGKTGDAIAALRQAAQDSSPAELEEEFNSLFIGLGSGEMVPYASWYLEKRIQSSPLAALRSDLIEMGIVRQTDCHEPEDHAGILCEIMAILSRKPEVSPATEEQFYRRHIAPWMATFFQDLQKAKSAEFYRPVGLLGSSFLVTEGEYLNRGTDTPNHKRRIS
ncbi:MAG: molecular chaperone TorD family protein [Deltaproteobacteria bacterium]|nr:molecular chaperone TorD family protein [Deltaproteobacteria bacterium]